MSKKVPGKSYSSFAPKLQSNISLNNSISSFPSQNASAVKPNMRQKCAVQKKKLDKRILHRSNFPFESRIQTDSSENDNYSGRPDVLSVDSDLSSNNDIADSPDRETVLESSLNSTLKQQNVSSDVINIQKLSLSGRELSKALSADYSYCTPPRVLNDENELEKKKGEQCRAFFSPSEVFDTESASVSNSYRQRTKAVHASSPNKAGNHVPLETERQSSVNVQSSSRSQEACQQRGSEMMDMKFTDLTHMQLKRSLDQIHDQNLRGAISRPYPEFVYNGGGQSSTNACYSHPINENLHLPSNVTSRLVGVSNPILNGCTEPGFYNHAGLTTSVPQSSKFDSILQVKDAMLQEKEAVILKLRLQVSSLQHQIQEGDAALRQVVNSNIPATSYNAKVLPRTVNQANELQTQKKIYDLEQLLGKAETKLVEKTSYFKSERKDMEEQIEKLQKSLKNHEQNHTSLTKKHKTTSERLDKYKKRVESLEKYLGDLPTIEESNKLKTEAGLLGEERENLVVEISALKRKLEEHVKTIVQKNMDIKQLEKEKSECQARVSQLEEKLAISEKSKRELGRTERDELEDVRYEVVRLQKEKEDAALMVAGCEKRIKQLQEKHKEESAKSQRRIADADEMAESLRRELFLKQQASTKVHTAVMNLSSQNQQLLEEKLSLQEKVKNLEKLHSNMKEASRASYRLQRESASALQDLRAVAQVLLETAKGADPNISALLGVRNDSIGGDEDFNFQSAFSGSEETPESGIEAALSVEQNNKRLLEVRKLRQEIDQLRTLLSNQYAEAIGDNCVTQ